jgi:hypothetical protein
MARGDALMDILMRTPWKFAKSYNETWPHEYVTRDQLGASTFKELWYFFEKEGRVSRFFTTAVRYYDRFDYSFWSDFYFPENTFGVINRVPYELSFDYRKPNHLMPRTKNWEAMLARMRATGRFGSEPLMDTYLAIKEKPGKVIVQGALFDDE